jgi:hypothetical protein
MAPSLTGADDAPPSAATTAPDTKTEAKRLSNNLRMIFP